MALLGLVGSAWAQQESIDRIEALYVLSEYDNAAALAQIRTFGEQMSSSTSYVVQREYLSRRIDMELDSAQIQATKISIAKLLALAKGQPKPDDIGQALAMGYEAFVLVLAAQNATAVIKLDEALPLALRSGDPAVLWQNYRVQGDAQLAMGKFETALESYLKSLQYADPSSTS